MSMERPDGSRELTPIAGLRTLLEKADLVARYSEAAKSCAELGVKMLNDLRFVWEELSTSLRLDLLAKRKLGAQCTDEARLQGYAANDSGERLGGGSDQSLTPELPDPGGSANPLDAATSRASSSSSTWQERQREDDSRRLAAIANRREVITFCIEGDYSAFDEAHERRLRKALAGELDAELSMDQIKFFKPTLSASRAAHIGTNRCRHKGGGG
jgi:hypothetical protein